MQTRLIPAIEVRSGDRLHYLTPGVLVVERLVAEGISGRKYILLHYAGGVRRVHIFAHVHKEDLRTERPTGEAGK